MCICMCIYRRIFIYVYKYVCMCIDIHIHTYMHLCAHTHICTHQVAYANLYFQGFKLLILLLSSRENPLCVIALIPGKAYTCLSCLALSTELQGLSSTFRLAHNSVGRSVWALHREWAQASRLALFSNHRHKISEGWRSRKPHSPGCCDFRAGSPWSPSNTKVVHKAAAPAVGLRYYKVCSAFTSERRFQEGLKGS